MQGTLDARPARNEDVTFRAVGCEYLLLNRLLKQYHVLNVTAARIWDLLPEGHTVRELAGIIAVEHGEDVGRVEQDVVETVDGLEALQLVVVGER